MTAWSIKQVKEFYASYAKKYDEEILPENYPAPFVIASWVVSYLANISHTAPDPLRVLDLGCGTGQSSKLFFTQPLTQDINVYGIDATPEDVETAFPYDRPFDAVICVGVMDFIKHPQKLFAAVAKSLRKSGGCFGVTLPESGELNTFSEEELLKLADANGFKLVKHDRFFGYEDSESKVVVRYHGILLRT
ncbi:hypothetical protein HKX48_005180 [Thoreauomyces humboldtii]|nr:hypothetical protein HKX48_005180 [Thoreauomyces humboldtii]